MSEGKYFWISCDEDGDVHVHTYTRRELEVELERRARDGDVPVAVFSAAFPGSDPQYWGGKSIIIKGEIIVPSPRDVIQRWELP